MLDKLLDKLKDLLTSKHNNEDNILDELWEQRKDILKETIERKLKDQLVIDIVKEDKQFFKDIFQSIRDNEFSAESVVVKALSRNEFKDALLKNFEYFLSPKCEPYPLHNLPEMVMATNPYFFTGEILKDLACLYVYYRYLDRKSLPFAVTQKIDFACDIVVSYAWMAAADFRYNAPKYDRLHKSTDILKNKKAAWKQFVLETYYQSDSITKDTKPHRIAKIIRGLLEKRMKPPPSLDTIKRYLKEDGII